MPLQYDSLDDDIRQHMADELRSDIEAATMYLSDRLNLNGREIWPSLLKEAVEGHEDAWLAEQIRTRGLLNSHYQRRKPKGGFTSVRMPSNARELLSEGEFNRLYCRGVCLSVLAGGGETVEVYRGKPVRQPRWESEQLIGQRVPADALLKDLRSSNGVDTALGVPPGPGSGLTVRR